MQDRLQNLATRKERGLPYLPTVAWTLNEDLRSTLENSDAGEIALGSIVGAGHMSPFGITNEQLVNAKAPFHTLNNLPFDAKHRTTIEKNYATFMRNMTNGAVQSPYNISDEQLAAIGTNRDNFRLVHSLSNKQLAALEKTRGGKPLRFIDTVENIMKQKNALKKELEKIYLKKRAQGAEKVLFSDCSYSAGFDANYADAILDLMEQYGPEHFIFSIFLPFNKQAVGEYSVPHGLHPFYWTARWQNLLNVAQTDQYKNSIFIHEPHFPEDPNYSPNEKEVHAKGIALNGDQNAAYSDVNRMMIHQALLAVKGNVKEMQGLFGESGYPSREKVGGAPEVMAMLRYLGVPWSNIHQIKDGLHNPHHIGFRRRAAIFNRFKDDLKAWDDNIDVRNAWGTVEEPAAPLRRKN